MLLHEAIKRFPRLHVGLPLMRDCAGSRTIFPYRNPREKKNANPALQPNSHFV